MKIIIKCQNEFVPRFCRQSDGTPYMIHCNFWHETREILILEVTGVLHFGFILMEQWSRLFLWLRRWQSVYTNERLWINGCQYRCILNFGSLTGCILGLTDRSRNRFDKDDSWFRLPESHVWSAGQSAFVPDWPSLYLLQSAEYFSDVSGNCGGQQDYFASGRRSGDDKLSIRRQLYPCSNVVMASLFDCRENVFCWTILTE